MENNHRYNYMILDRLKMDCEYFLGHGNRSHKRLWALNPTDQIKEMKRLYELVPVKPKWLTKEQIEKYEKEMVLEPTPETTH